MIKLGEAVLIGKRIARTDYSVISIAVVAKMPGTPPGWKGKVAFGSPGIQPHLCEWQSMNGENGDIEVICPANKALGFRFVSDPAIDASAKEIISEWLAKNQDDVHAPVREPLPPPEPRPLGRRTYERPPMPDLPPLREAPKKAAMPEATTEPAAPVPQAPADSFTIDIVAARKLSGLLERAEAELKTLESVSDADLRSFLAVAKAKGQTDGQIIMKIRSIVNAWHALRMEVRKQIRSR